MMPALNRLKQSNSRHSLKPEGDRCTFTENAIDKSFILPDRLTYYTDSSYLIHEQGREDVARQHSQAAQEADHVDDDVVFLLEVQVTAFLRVEEGGVFQPTVFELLLPQIWNRRIWVKSEVVPVVLVWLMGYLCCRRWCF